MWGEANYPMNEQQVGGWMGKGWIGGQMGEWIGR